ncbi:MAG: hypothetical protein ACYCZA_05475 [Thiobacillus sp.]
MTGTVHRLWQILGVVEKEALYLRSVISRLFPQAGALTADQLQNLLDTPEGIDRLESFVGKFSRMQDTLVDKLLPTFLLAVGEEPGTALDNLLRAEKLGFVSHADAWLAMRHLRNRLVHEYVDDPLEFAAALEKARAMSAELFLAYDAIKRYAAEKLPAGL